MPHVIHFLAHLLFSSPYVWVYLSDQETYRGGSGRSGSAPTAGDLAQSIFYYLAP